MKQIKITHTERPTGFGRMQKHEYEGVIFTGGKVAYVNKNEEVYVYDGEDKLKKDLEKSGRVEIDEHITNRVPAIGQCDGKTTCD